MRAPANPAETAAATCRHLPCGSSVQSHYVPPRGLRPENAPRLPRLAPRKERFVQTMAIPAPRIVREILLERNEACGKRVAYAAGFLNHQVLPFQRCR